MSRRFVEASSTMMRGRTADYYGIAKYGIRKQWALVVDNTHCLDVAAYFRSEAYAREFARAFGLDLTVHGEDQ